MSNRLSLITFALALLPLACTELAIPEPGVNPDLGTSGTSAGDSGADGTTDPMGSSASDGLGGTDAGDDRGGEESEGGEDTQGVGDTDESGGPDEVHGILSVQGLYNYAIEHEITNVRDLLSALPPTLGQSYALMEETRSRHEADLEHPRLIMFGVDAQFMVSVGGVPSDPIYEVVEMAEVDSETGEWKFRTIDFQDSPPTLSTNDDGCRGCHGTPARPIWGSYPEWPGAFGNDDDNLSDEQVSMLLDLRENQSNSDRYHHLELPSEHSLSVNKSLYLDSRGYGYANTAFNFELGMAHAEGLVRRMTRHDYWEVLKYDVLNAHWCDIGSSPEVLDQLGLDGANDFQLEVPVTDAIPGLSNSTFDWNHGSADLVEIINFLVLDEIVRVDPGMAEAIEAIEPKRSSWIEYLFKLEGDARAEWIKEYPSDDYYLQPDELIEPVKAQICAELASR